MVLIYRVEHSKDGLGPYQRISFNHYSSWDCIIRPTPEDDGIYFYDKTKSKYDYYYGFSSIDDLTCWFNRNDRRHLKKNNYIISLYNCPKKFTIFGRKQIVFLKTKAKKIRKYKINELEQLL